MFMDPPNNAENVEMEINARVGEVTETGYHAEMSKPSTIHKSQDFNSDTLVVSEFSGNLSVDQNTIPDSDRSDSISKTGISFKSLSGTGGQSESDIERSGHIKALVEGSVDFCEVAAVTSLDHNLVTNTSANKTNIAIKMLSPSDPHNTIPLTKIDPEDVAGNLHETIVDSDLSPPAKRLKVDTVERDEVKSYHVGNVDFLPSSADLMTDSEVTVTEVGSGPDADHVEMTSEHEINTELGEPQHSNPITVMKSVYQFNGPPKQLTGAWQSFISADDCNYLRGCKWAPDGTCILTNSNDNVIRLYNLPEQLYVDGGEDQNIAEMSPVLKMKEADTIYDYCWYPTMSSADPVTACLAVTCRDTPVHLYDAFSGDLRCSYRAYNQVDEITAAHSVVFDPCGEKLYCGFSKMIRVFDVSRPGRECQNRPTFAKQGQRGLISCIAHSPRDPGLYAAGSYARSIALYQEPKGEMICMFEGQQGGVTQMMFSPDGTKLYSGGRKDNEILCWDLRNPGQILYSLIRTVSTNQRIYFDITCDGVYLVTGSHDGNVIVWDTSQPPVQTSIQTDPILQPMMAYQAHTDTVNGISLHPSLPIVATASGQRHFPSYQTASDDDDDDTNDDSDKETTGKQNKKVDNSLRLWWTTIAAG